ncbi:MAG: D-2-hydroxyacid dehydrogenase [bacterium]|jgi:D-2-hydroxyacid dehydrogenase (NADP+)
MKHTDNGLKRLTIGVSGIPRGYHFPGPDGNWLRPEHREKILQAAPGSELREIPAGRVDAAAADGIEVLLAEGGNRIHYPGELDWEDYQRFFQPALRWVQLCSTGFSDNITPEITDGSVTLTNAPGLHTGPIAESVLAAMLAHAKNLDRRRLDQAAHAWRQVKNSELFRSTVLIIGLGRIGQETARLCRAFAMRVIGTKRHAAPVPNVDLVFPPEELAAHLPKADFIVMAVPLTPATENMIGPAEFAAMRETAYLINVGRGRAVDEAAMVEALQAGRIAGAYLDAFVTEPLPPDHVLWDLPNVRLVPHDSHSSPYIGDRMVDIFCANLRRYVWGEPLQNICDPRRGY